MAEKTKLVAVTHNYIGPNVTNSLPNKVIELDDRVIVPISGEHLIALDPPVFGRSENRGWLIGQVRDPEIATQQPDVLLLYVGRSPVGQALRFASLFRDAAIHLVLNNDGAMKLNFQEEFDRDQWPFWPILHFAESTGNYTMDRLVQQFRDTGAIGAEAIWW